MAGADEVGERDAAFGSAGEPVAGERIGAVPVGGRRQPGDVAAGRKGAVGSALAALAREHEQQRDVALYDHLPNPQRLAAHTKAAEILAASGASAEQVASHLLITPPRADPKVVAVLRQAAAQASERGSAQCAASYLKRALKEPPAPELRERVLAELGIAEHNANDPAAASHLTEALAQAGDEQQRARIGLVAARAIWHTGKITEAVALLDLLADHLDPQLAAPLEGELIAIACLDPRTREIGLRRIHCQDPDQIEDLARRLLLAHLAFEHAVAASQPAAGVVRLAQRALAGGRLLDREGSESTVYYLAVWALAQADAFQAAEAHMQAGLELARGGIAGGLRAGADLPL